MANFCPFSESGNMADSEPSQEVMSKGPDRVSGPLLCAKHPIPQNKHPARSSVGRLGVDSTDAQP